jgi:serine/threonine protein kinase
VTLTHLLPRRNAAGHAPAHTAPHATARPATGAAGCSAAVAEVRPEPVRGRPLGERLIGDRYRLGQLLGRGSEANVYRAADLLGGADVAVKIFRTAAEDAASPFRRERELHSPIRHENVVRLLGHGRVAADGGLGSGRNYVVTELVSGPDLRSVLQDKGLDALQVTAWMSDIAAALVHLHRKGIVHNDVKPANIVLDRSGGTPSLGLVKLTDFGIATSARHRPNSATSGTPHYLSPEAVHGTGTSNASDIYALGLVTFECLTGIKAFPGPALESMVARTLRAPRLPETVGRRWSVLLHAMTDVDPAKRPTAAGVRRALLRIHR